MEDNPGDALIIQEMLKEIYDNKFDLHRFQRVNDGLKHLNEDFDIMLLDLNLPDSQGIETFNTMNNHAPELPIIILTGLIDQDFCHKYCFRRCTGLSCQGPDRKQLLQDR